MIYLILKFSLVFLLATIIGFLFGRWWVRRSFIDVSESYHTLSKAASTSQWDKLWAYLDRQDPSIEAIIQRQLRHLPEVNLDDVREHIITAQKSIEKKLETLIDSRLQNTKEMDLTPLQEQIEQIKALIHSQPKPKEATSLDITPINQKLRSLEIALTNISHTPDFTPVHTRLDIIETKLEELLKQQSNTVENKIYEAPKLLSAASFGAKDDLKRISGVGLKLEALLNQHGVYYFWQIGSWTAENIQAMDDRLEVFKGRIERDNWIEQAKQFTADPTTAVEPAELMDA